MERATGQRGTQKDTLVARVIAFVIDIILVAVVGVVITGILGVISGRLATLAGVLVGLIAIIYFIYMEGAYGQTIGKRVMNIVVVKKNGEPLGMVGSAIRNVLRIVDNLPAFYILGFVVIFLTDDNQRIGDLAADSVVLKAV